MKHVFISSRFLSVLFASFLLIGCGEDSMVNSSSDSEEMEENTSTFRTGPFNPVAAGKEASGSATLRTLENGMLQLDFSENFSVSNGPGLFVFLSNSEFPSPDAVNLGSFISPTGAQMYSIPDGVSLSSFTHVAVHCVPYNVTFASAKLQ